MVELVRSKEIQPKWGIFGDDLDNMFEGFFRPMRRLTEASDGSFVPAVDVIENETAYTVKAELPGVKKEDIDVSINNGVLTINGETKSDEEDKDKEGRVIRRERHFGQYVRSMQLGGVIDESAVKATYKDGVLELELPKVEEAKPKKVDIQIQ